LEQCNLFIVVWQVWIKILELAKTNKKEKLGGFCCSCEHWKYYGKKNIKFIIIGDQTPIVHIKPLLIFLFLF